MNYELIYTDFYMNWFNSLKDSKTKNMVYARLARVAVGNLGDRKYLSDEIYELRFRAGIRIYYAFRDDSIILLLNGGGKSSKTAQNKDIKTAKRILGDLNES